MGSGRDIIGGGDASVDEERHIPVASAATPSHKNEGPPKGRPLFTKPKGPKPLRVAGNQPADLFTLAA